MLRGHDDLISIKRAPKIAQIQNVAMSQSFLDRCIDNAARAALRQRVHKAIAAHPGICILLTVAGNTSDLQSTS
jgi:hypothetical protein